jgi:hypothetical protein
MDNFVSNADKSHLAVNTKEKQVKEVGHPNKQKKLTPPAIPE